MASEKAIEQDVLKVMALHETWMRPQFLKSVLGISLKDLRLVLNKLKKKKTIKESPDSKDLFCFADSEVRKKIIEKLAAKKKGKLHQKIFKNLTDYPDTENWEAWLAFHAASGKLSTPAFSWNIRSGDSWGQKENPAQALAYYDCALEFAETDFKKAYVLGLKAEAQAALGNFTDCLNLTKEALKVSKQVPWDDFILDYNLNLAQLYSHLGKYHQAEEFYQGALKILKDKGYQQAWLMHYQGLGRALLEQAKYPQARTVFEECLKVYQEQKDEFNVQLMEINLAQVDHLSGNTLEASKKLKEIKEGLSKDKMKILSPFIRLLEGKFEITLGGMGGALRILEEAAQGFEEIGDINGKVEVLLTMSAPFLEHYLIQEAWDVINLLANWSELKNYPALEHSIRLRRLALATFAGNLNLEDLALMKENEFAVGRAEDWLQFYFHLALAGRQPGNEEFFQTFIQKAKDLAIEMADHLGGEFKKNFLKRPDVARIFRLSEEKLTRPEPAVKARRDIEMEGPAEPGTLAPPVVQPISKKPSDKKE